MTVCGSQSLHRSRLKLWVGAERRSKLQSNCSRNRKRSRRRAIFCPCHGCYLDSVSQKHSLFADKAEHLQARGVRRKNALMLVASRTTVPLEGEWLEAFWCDQCQMARWYHVSKIDGKYSLEIANPDLWQQATGVIHPDGNSSVGEFTRRQARMLRYNKVNDFHFCG